MNWTSFAKEHLPTRKNERWKYADLTFLAQKNFVEATRVDAEQLVDAIDQHRLRQGNNALLVLVNGFFMPSLSDMDKLPKEMIVCGLQQAADQYMDVMQSHWGSSIDTKKYPFAGLNAQMCQDGLFIQVPDHFQSPTPIHVLSIAIGTEEFIAQPWLMLVLGEKSALTLVEEYYSTNEQMYLMNVVTTMSVGKEAHLDHYKIQNEGKKAVHMANTFVNQQQDSQTAFANFSMGALFARDDTVVKLQETGANCRTAGFYHLIQDNQYVDHHVDINHVAPSSHSDMLYKGILENKSRAVFNGRLHVAKDAQKIVAHQANHNLLISKQAEVYSKPELEIYADDVKCKHGATTGQLDQDALYYMCSRGIPRDEAAAILLQGFAQEITQMITHPGVKLRVLEMCQINKDR